MPIRIESGRYDCLPAAQRRRFTPARRSLAIALALCIVTQPGGVFAQGWSRDEVVRERVQATTFELGSVVYFVPAEPSGVAVLVHGYPWPDDSRTTDQLVEHARSYVERWQPFASEERLVLIAPALGSGDFAGYRELFGRTIDADDFVTLLVDSLGAWVIPNFDRRFYLYGHSAGAQFASRYVVVHPERLDGVVISAPSTYPFPDSSIAWPYGMAPITRTEAFSGSVETGKAPHKRGGETFRPDPNGWNRAAAEVPIAVIVGAADTETRSPAPGHEGSTRIERAEAWVNAMRGLAREIGASPDITLTLIDSVAHDPVALTGPTQALLIAVRERPALQDGN